MSAVPEDALCHSLPPLARGHDRAKGFFFFNRLSIIIYIENRIVEWFPQFP